MFISSIDPFGVPKSHARRGREIIRSLASLWPRPYPQAHRALVPILSHSLLQKTRTLDQMDPAVGLHCTWLAGTIPQIHIWPVSFCRSQPTIDPVSRQTNGGQRTTAPATQPAPSHERDSRNRMRVL